MEATEGNFVTYFQSEMRKRKIEKNSEGSNPKILKYTSYSIES